MSSQQEGPRESSPNAGCTNRFPTIRANVPVHDSLDIREKYLRDFVESAPLGLHWVADDGRILWANQAELDLLGYHSQEYIGRHIADFHVDAPVIAEILSALKRGETLVEQEARLCCKDGSIRHVRISSSALFENGTFIHTRCFTRDITSQKRIEAEWADLLTREAAARQDAEALCELSQMLAKETHIDALLQTVTDFATTLTGAQFGAAFVIHTKDQKPSYRLAAVSGEFSDDVASLGNRPNSFLLDPTLRDRQVVRFLDQPKETPKDQDFCPIGIPVGSLSVRSYLAVPIVSRFGEVLGGLVLTHKEPGIFLERAERMSVGLAAQAAVALDNASLLAQREENEQRFRQMIDALPAAIYTTDAAGRLTHFNPAAVELSGRVPTLGTDQWCVSWKLYHSDGRPLPHNECPMAIAVTEGHPLRGVEAIAERPDGTRVWFMPYPSPLRNAHGDIIGGINMLIDITERKQAEARSAHLSAIVESSDDAIVSTDLHGIILSWNQGAERLFGYTAEEIIGQAVHRIIPPQRAHEERRILDQVSRGEHLHHYETVRRRKNGQLIDVSLTVSPIKDAQGRIIGASKISRDITDQKLQLQQRQQLFDFATAVNRAEALDDLYEKALDVITQTFTTDRASILLCDPDGHMRFTAFRRLSPQYRHAVEGHSPWDKDDPSPCEIVFDDIAQAELDQPLKATVLHEGIRALAFIPLTYNRRLIGKFMVYFDHPRSMNPQDVQLARAIADTLALAIERKRSEEVLRESELRFRTLADHIAQFAWMADATGSIFWYNQRWYDFTGTSLASMQGWGWKRVHHPDHIERVETIWRRALLSGEPWEDTFPLRGCDGTYHWFLSRALPIRNADGQIDRWFGTNTDITDLREAQASLRVSQQELQAFSSGLEKLVEERTKDLMHSQHRLRHLATELNLAEQRERKRLAVELHDHLQQLLVLGRLKLGQGKRALQNNSAVHEIMTQTDDVLSQALTYTRTLVAELSPPVLLEHGLLAGLAWLGEHMRQHHIAVTVECRLEELRLPEEQAVLLFQSVRELLLNAAKHADASHATVQVEHQNDVLHIEVADQGKGFDPLNMTNSQSSAPLSSKFGLFSIRERMRALGGRFEIASARGKGTTAILELPLATQPIGSTPVSDRRTIGPCDNATREAESSSRPRLLNHVRGAIVRVLLVDDHAMMRQGLKSVLESYSDLHIVGEAQNGEEAVTLVHELRPSVVIMDINMPTLNGIEATARIKSQFPQIAVIGLSVNADGLNQTAMLQAGATRMMTKEAAVEELYQAIQASIGVAEFS